MHTALALATLKLLMHSILMECLTTTAPNKYLINTKKSTQSHSSTVHLQQLAGGVWGAQHCWQQEAEKGTGAVWRNVFHTVKKIQVFHCRGLLHVPDTSKTFRVKLVVGREEKNISTWPMLLQYIEYCWGKLSCHLNSTVKSFWK